MKQRIVLLGGGYTSLFAYRNLVKSRKVCAQIANGELEIVLISDRKRHYFHGFTGEVITEVFTYDAICTPLEQLFPKATIIYGSVTQVSPFLQTVYYRQENKEHEIFYNELVVGVGTVDQPLCDDSPEYAHAIKKPNGLQEMLDYLNYCFVQHAEYQIKERNIVVIGGGFTGVELATNIRTYLEKQSSLTNTTIQIVTRGDSVLPVWAEQQPSLYRYTQKQLQKLHIKVITNTDVKTVDGDRLILSNGETIDHAFAINASGQKKVALKGLQFLTLTNGSRYVANEYLQAEKMENIWVGGDAALVAKPFTKTYCPQNALWAIMHGKKIGNNLRRTLSNKRLVPFYFPGLGLAANLGKNRGVMELFGLPITGPVAALLRMAFFLYFFPHKKRLYKKYVAAKKTPAKKR